MTNRFVSLRSWAKGILWGGCLGFVAVGASSLLLAPTSILWLSVLKPDPNENLLIELWKLVTQWPQYTLLGSAFVFFFAVVPGTLGGVILAGWLRFRVMRLGHLPFLLGALYGMLLGGIAGMGADRFARALLGGQRSALTVFDPIDVAALSLALISGSVVGIILAWVFNRERKPSL